MSNWDDFWGVEFMHAQLSRGSEAPPFDTKCKMCGKGIYRGEALPMCDCLGNDTGSLCVECDQQVTDDMNFFVQCAVKVKRRREGAC